MKVPLLSQNFDALPIRLKCCLVTAALLLLPGALMADLSATFNAASDVPVTASSYSASGAVEFTLNFAPEPGTNLTVVKNTGVPFIDGAFSNLANGAAVNLSFNGTSYPFVAWYYGGEGNNDLVLLWPYTGLAAWGENEVGELGNGAFGDTNIPVRVDQTGVLAGKTIVQLVRGGSFTMALTTEGRVYAWGHNVYGKLGNNSTTNSAVPVAVNTESGTSALFGKTVVWLAAGFEHSVAVCSDGTVAAWGRNDDYQVGDNTTQHRWVPVAVNTESGTSALFGKFAVCASAGYRHTLVLCSDGTMVSWGINSAGQLGDSTLTQRLTPVRTGNGSVAMTGRSVVSIASGGSHSLALCSDGTLMAWGGNSYGELGDNTTSHRSVVAPVNTASGTSALSGRTVVALAAGTAHSVALCSDGTVTTWGCNFFGQIGDNTLTHRLTPFAVTTGALSGKTVMGIAAGMHSTVALCSDGSIADWGVGIDYTVYDTIPVAVIRSGVSALNGVKATRVADSGSQSFHAAAMYGALFKEITVQGNGREIASGDMVPDPADRTDFGAVLLNTGPRARTFAIANTGIAELNLTGVPKVSISGPHAADFTVTSEPSTSVAPLIGTTTFQITFAPTAPGIRSATVSILNDDSDESSYTFAIQGLGSLSGFSFDNATDVAVTVASYTALGDASLTLNFAPDPGTSLTMVKNTGTSFIEGTFNNLTNGAMVSLSYNGVHYPFVVWYYGGEGNNDLVLLWPGTSLAVWGNNSAGQLAVANYSDYRHFTPEVASTYGVMEGKTIVQVAQGEAHTLALTTEGKIYAWGRNSVGQLGDNTLVSKSTPVEVNTTSGVSSLAGKTVVAIAAGNIHNLALCSDGTVSAWGSSYNGVLGNGTANNSSVPVAVNTSSGTSALHGKVVTAVAAGGGHNLVLCSDGTVAAWGDNSGGQLGDGTYVQRGVPVAVNATEGVSALSGKVVSSIMGGAIHSLALCSDGSLVAWGMNGKGQLGDGSETTRPLPVTVSMTGVLEGKTVTSISTGGQHNLALCSDGTVAAWGDNDKGQIGDSTSQYRTLPVMVNTTAGISVLAGKMVISIACGSKHSLALCSDNTLSAWGDNEYGQLGADFSRTSDLVPWSVSMNRLGVIGAGKKVTGLPNRSGGGSGLSSVVMLEGGLRDIFVSGNNQEIVSGDTAPEAADFTDFGDSPLVGETVKRTFLIANKGVGILSFTGSTFVEIYSNTFYISRQPAQTYTSSNGRVSFEITCTPRFLGTQTANVIIRSDDPDEAVYTFTIQCFGKGSEIEIRDQGVNVAAGSANSFGNVGRESGLVQKTFVINNLGNADLTGLTLTKTGQNAGDYTILVPPTAPIPPGGSTSFTVEARPSGHGARTATLAIANNDFNEGYFPIYLTVTGVDVTLPVTAKPVVTAITFEGAMLKAEVNAQNSERSVFFEYGTTSYSSRVAATPATVTGNSPTPVSTTISGLLPNTLYRFRVRAEGALGSMNGADKTFTTLNRPPVALNDTALALPSGKITIPVLENDSDAGDVLSIASFTPPAAAVGSVAKVGSSLVFTPAASFAGGSFTYMAGDSYRAKSTAATVTVALASCTIGPDVTIPADSPPYELAVSANAPWTVVENLPWLSFVPPVPGANSVTIIPVPNASKTSRTAVVKVGGQTHNVTQSGVGEMPVLTVPSPIPPAAISASYELPIPTQNGPVTYTANGLPKGLTLSNVTGKITGYPTEAKTSTVTVKAKNVMGDSNTISFGITVLPFPPTMAGSYSAIIEGDTTLTDKLGGLMTMTVTSTGGVTGTLKLGAGSHSFTGRMNTAVDPSAPDPNHAVLKTSVKRPGKPNVELTIHMNTPGTDLIAGEVTLPGAQSASVDLAGSRHVWHATSRAADDFKGYYTVALQPTSTATDIPQGDGFLTFTVSPAGAVSWSGQLADGTIIPTQSAALWVDGRLPLFALLYGGKGSLHQHLSVMSGTRMVTGSPHWHKKPQAMRAYGAGFEPTPLLAVGGEYLPPVAGKTLLNRTAPATFVLDFLDGGINGVRNFTYLDQVFTMSAKHVLSTAGENPEQVKLTKIDAAKGTFTGSMTLKDTNPHNASLPEVSRPVTFQGVLVPSLNMSTGYFLLPSIIGSPVNVKTSPMTSGQVRIQSL